jgi:mobilization protein NikA
MARREPRTERMEVRLTPADKHAIERAAAKVDMTPSEYLRASALTLMAVDLDPYALRAAARNAGEIMREKLRELVGAVMGRATS